MQTLLQRGSFHQRPTWLRLMALLCVLMVCVMGTVQIAHTHASSALLKQGPHNGPATDDHCPFCVVMLSDMPVSMATPEPILQIHALDTVAADAERIFRWRFEMACRPPPADTDRA
ncbi:MAG TPA: hypothetical protein VF214_10730 [Edaphobacter sp.]